MGYEEDEEERAIEENKGFDAVQQEDNEQNDNDGGENDADYEDEDQPQTENFDNDAEDFDGDNGKQNKKGQDSQQQQQQQTQTDQKQGQSKNPLKKPDGKNGRGDKPLWKPGDPITVELLSKVWDIAVKHQSTSAMCKTANTAVDNAVAGGTILIGTVVTKILDAGQFVIGKKQVIGDTIGTILSIIANSTMTIAIFDAKKVLESILNTGIIVALLTPIFTIIVPIMQKTKKE